MTRQCEKTVAVKKGPWSPEEDEKLVAYIQRYGTWNWSQMPKPAGRKQILKFLFLSSLYYAYLNKIFIDHLGTRSFGIAFGKVQSAFRQSQAFLTNDLSSSAFALGLARSGKSCRLRWVNYLRPDIKRGNFSKDEEETILELHQAIGNR